MRQSNYDKFPSIAAPSSVADQCWLGWADIGRQLCAKLEALAGGRHVIAVECYPGVHDDLVREALASQLNPQHVFDAKQAFKQPDQIDALVAPWLGGDDPVFGRMCPLELGAFLDSAKAAALSSAIHSTEDLVLLVGPGASLLEPEADLLVYADMPRWEGQLRQRRNEVSNLGVANQTLKASLQYKRSFFIDWRVCDRLKRRTMERWDFLLDTTDHQAPKLITSAAMQTCLRQAVAQPFRVLPLFDPGPWGGQWMKEVCDLNRAAPNYAWCFDCVPEENSLQLAFAGGVRVELPAQNLVLAHPESLLGEAVYGRFGAEFPIRFDFLDTMGGGNLSFQVHPSTDYARDHFGLAYTQDESYYMLDAEPGAEVFLGCRNGIDGQAMLMALEEGHRGGPPFPAEQYAARFPAKKHDHFLIPAGTLHCSGAGGMVLEISATPYIFTFKLWDWGRLGLDGQPRPLNIQRGKDVIRWERDEDYARQRLINQVQALAYGDGWREERTGLHEAEFIETRRHWFTKAVPHHTHGNVHVLNLVHGDEAVVESPTGAFAPFVIHYAETFIVPAAVGAYTVRPFGVAQGTECATMQAFVRKNA
jgi:mannose-6-phosphate isomerase class I